VSLVAKVFVVLNLILSVAFLVFAMNVWTAPTKWQKMYEVEKAKNVEFLAKTQKREKELAMEVVAQQGINDVQKKDNINLHLRLNDTRDKQLQTETELASVKNARDMKDAENQELQRELARYGQEMTKLKGVVIKQQQAVIVERENAIRARNEKTELENELNVTKQTLSALQRDKRTIEEDLALQTRRIERLLEAGVPVYRFLNEDPSATQPSIADAQILAVRPDVGLVMISAGTQQNVKPGYQFTISRGDQYVAKVQVEKVYPDMCSARLVPGMLKQGMEVQVHDEARSR
jgi:hypothetical protein